MIACVQLCRALMRLYADAIANPFYNGDIETPNFVRKLGKVHTYTRELGAHLSYHEFLRRTFRRGGHKAL